MSTRSRRTSSRCPSRREFERRSCPRPSRFGELVRQTTGAEPRGLRLLATDEGPVVFLTVRVPPETPLAEAHGRASAIEAAIREARPEMADVIVHTEP